MPISLSKTFEEYKKSLGQSGTSAAGFPQTYKEYASGLSTDGLKRLYAYARENYSTGVPKTYADFLNVVDQQLPAGTSQRLTHHAIQAAGRQLGITPRETITPEQARESLKVQGALLTEMPIEQDIETPTGAPRVDTQISTGLVGVDAAGQLPKPTITTGLDDILPKVSVPEEGSFAPAPASTPSPTLRQPTAPGTMVTRKGEPTASEEEPTVAGRLGAALVRGSAGTLDAIGGIFETIANAGVTTAQIEKDVYGALGFTPGVEMAEEDMAQTLDKGYLDLTTARDYASNLVGDKRVNDVDIKNPLVRSALSGLEMFTETVPDLALIVGTGSPQAIESLGARITPEIASFLYKSAPKTKGVATKVMGKLFGESVTSPAALRTLQVDWVQPFKAAAKSDFAVYLGAKEASLTMQDSDASTLASVGEGIKAFGMGYANGMFFEKIGLTPVKLASSIAVKTGTPIAGLAANMLGTGGVGFAGDVLLQASEQVSEGKEIHPDYYQALASAVAFSGATALHGRNIIANTKAGIRAEQWRNLMEMENKTVDYCLNNAYDAPTLNAKIDDMLVQRDAIVSRMERTMNTKGKYDSKDANKLQGIDAQTSAYRQVLLTQSFTKEIIQNPEKFRNEILDNPNLKAEIKDKLCQRIDAIVQEFDPINVESRRLQTNINDWQFAKVQLDPADPMTAKKLGIYDKQIAKAEDRIAELSVAPTYYYKGEFYDTHGALIDALNKRYVDGTSSEVIVRNDPQASKLVNESLNQLLDRKFNEGVKVQQTQEIAKAESQPERDLAITQAQERLKLPTEPELLVSDQAVAALDRALAGESADVTKVQHASDQLYAETKRLEKMKDVDGRQYTIEQLENAQRQAFEDVAFAENYIQAKKAGETPDIKTLREEAKVTADDAINDIRERRQILLPESVKAKLNAPKPEAVSAEPVAKVDNRLITDLKELWQTNSTEILNRMKELGEITYTNEEGKPCLEQGVYIPNKGTPSISTWDIVQDLKGAPSHNKGGTDITIQGTEVEAEGSELILRNTNGSIAIIPKKHRQEVTDMLREGCHNCLTTYIETLPKNPEIAEDGGIYDSGYVRNTFFNRIFRRKDILEHQIMEENPALKNVAPLRKFHAEYASSEDTQTLRDVGHSPEYISPEEGLQAETTPEGIIIPKGKMLINNDPQNPKFITVNNPGDYTTVLPKGTPMQEARPAITLDFISHALHADPTYNTLSAELHNHLKSKYSDEMIQNNGGVDAYMRGLLSTSPEYAPYKEEMKHIPQDFKNKVFNYIKTGK